MAKLNHVAIDKTIRQHWGKLRKKGVLAVRPGYTFTGGWITDQPAAVAIVDKKKHLPPKDLLPSRIGDVPVDVQEAGPFERMRHTDPELHARVAHGRPEYDVPAAPFERTMNAKGASPASVPRHPKAPTSRSKSKKTPLQYSAPSPAPSLAAVTGNMTITRHASPDAGWLELQQFLGKVQQSLTVGLYDFTSAHVLKAFLSGMRGRQELTMVLDHPSANQSADQSDEQTRGDILSALKTRADFAWALDAMDPLVRAKIYPSAYHIKVAVRDSNTFWLSQRELERLQPARHQSDPQRGSGGGHGEKERPRLARDRATCGAGKSGRGFSEARLYGGRTETARVTRASDSAAEEENGPEGGDGARQACSPSDAIAIFRSEDDHRHDDDHAAADTRQLRPEHAAPDPVGA
jgi:hypothetical protein